MARKQVALMVHKYNSLDLLNAFKSNSCMGLISKTISNLKLVIFLIDVTDKFIMLGHLRQSSVTN